MSDNPAGQAVPIGDYQIVVVHEDTSVERFGLFISEDEAVGWAMTYRDPLGLAWSASWYVEHV